MRLHCSSSCCSKTAVSFPQNVDIDEYALDPEKKRMLVCDLPEKIHTELVSKTWVIHNQTATPCQSNLLPQCIALGDM